MQCWEQDTTPTILLTGYCLILIASGDRSLYSLLCFAFAPIRHPLGESENNFIPIQ